MSLGAYTLYALIGLGLVVLFAVILVFVWVLAVLHPPPTPPAGEASAPEMPQEPRKPVYVALGLANVQSLFHNETGAGDDWPDRLYGTMPADTQFVKLGEHERTLRDLNAHLLADAISQQPTVLTLWQVVGDATGGTALTGYLQELRQTLHLLVEETDAEVFLLNLPDLSLLLIDATDERRELVRGGVEQWNRVLAEVATPHGNRVRLVDLYPHSRAILDMEGGNRALAEVVKQEMDGASL